MVDAAGARSCAGAGCRADARADEPDAAGVRVYLRGRGRPIADRPKTGRVRHERGTAVTAVGADHPPGAAGGRGRRRRRPRYWRRAAATTPTRTPVHPLRQPSRTPERPIGATAATRRRSARLAKTSDIPVGRRRDLRGVAAWSSPSRPRAQFKAFSSTCTHQGCPVAERRRAARSTAAATAASSRSRTARRSNGPATKPLTEQAVTVDGRQHRPGVTRTAGRSDAPRRPAAAAPAAERI